MSRPSILVFLVTLVFAVMTFAAADSLSEPGYVPVQVGAVANGSNVVVVQRGDHLWKISKEGLSTFLERTPTNAEISPYWRETISVNADELRSGDPNLIFPGEKVILPDFSTDSP